MKYILLVLWASFAFTLKAQDSLIFTNIITIDVNSVESQGKTGTCWSYATASFLESELIRMGKGTYNLSEMYVARNVYVEKAENYFRRHGKTNFGEGSLSHDLINTIDKYGLVPNEVFDGLSLDNDKHDHSELSKLLKAYLDVIIQQKKPSKLWRDGYEAILDVYLGLVPEDFSYKGKKYTPRTFANHVNLNSKDYVNLTSFLHNPFYDWFILDLPDNWSNGSFFNIQLNDMIDVAKHALKMGFSIAWDTDVSNDNFDSKNGTAKIDLEVDQHVRQQYFDNYTVTDDHLMHIVGMANGSDGQLYFLVKNSWGDERGMLNYEGYVWVSENYFKLNTISIMLHKDGILKNVLKKIYK